MTEPSFRIGEITIQPDVRQAFVGGTSVQLSHREFDILSVLAHTDGELAYDEIYQRVWGCPMADGDRSVHVFVRKLHHKLQRASPGWRYIQTGSDRGYRCSPARADDEPA